MCAVRFGFIVVAAAAAADALAGFAAERATAGMAGFRGGRAGGNGRLNSPFGRILFFVLIAGYGP